MFRPLVLALAMIPAAASASTVYVTEATTAHARPAADSAEVLAIAACTALDAIGMSHGWLAIRTNQGPAYVRAIHTQSSAAYCLGANTDGGDWSGGGEGGGSDPDAPA